MKPIDTNAPSVLSVSPQPGSVLNELDAPIVVRFSKPMNQNATQQAISFSPTITGAVCAWDDTGSVLTITHQPLTAGGSYTCAISTGARDSGGTTMQSQYQWTFSTVPLISFDPGDIGAAAVKHVRNAACDSERSDPAGECLVQARRPCRPRD